jgi:hypothetical protein
MIRSLIPVRWWTRRCRGNCNDRTPHTDHLTMFGRLWLSTFRTETAR